MAIQSPLAVPRASSIVAILGNELRKAGLEQLVGLVTNPAISGMVSALAAAMLDQMRGRGFILADPSEPIEPAPGAIELMVAVLHQLPNTEEQKLVKAFIGALEDLAELPDVILAGRMLPPPGDWLKAPAPLLNYWLPVNEAAKGETLRTFDNDMGIDRDRLAYQLESIDSDAEARTLVHGGHLGAALRLGRAFGCLEMAETEDLIRGFARLLVIIVGHLRTALLRRWGTQPMTGHVAFDHDWQTLGRSMMTAVVGPAAAIKPILSISKGPQTFAEVPAFLAGTPLAKSAFEALVGDAMGRLAPTSGKGGLGFDDHVKRVQAEAFEMASKVAGIRYADLKKDELTRKSFVMDRLGVSATQGAVLIGWSMLSAPETIDACIEAVKAGRPLPAPVASDALLNPLAVGLLEMVRATDLLRRAVKPDREASKLGAARRFGQNTCIEMVRHAMAEFAFNPPQQAIGSLWVNPRPYFA